VTPNGQIWEITGGTQAGGNLFHSFEKFSVLTGETAFFNHALDIQNIFSRVTGNSISEIDGLIRANGTANLFLLNPNGIMFGPNARLDIGGSFFASTADRINFAGGNFFSATEPEASPVLTINVPIGLQFGASPGAISNQSRVSNSNEQTVGLQVQPGKTLGLLGGEVMFDGGALTTEGGLIQVGSVAGNSQVSLSPINQGWKFGYEEVNSFQNILLNNGAFISASTFGKGDAGNLTVHADSIEIVGNGNMGDILNKILSNQFTPDDLRDGLFTASFGEGKAGDLAVTTSHLHLSNGGLISASSFGNGLGGNLNINASGIVSVNNSGLLTGTRASNELGGAGNLTINTGRLIVEAGGIVATSTLGSGEGGDLTINASEFVKVISSAPSVNLIRLSPQVRFAPGISALLTATLQSGNAGDLEVNTERLIIENGSQISSDNFGDGKAGNLMINAADSLEIIGQTEGIDKMGTEILPRILSTSTSGGQTAGDITINTGRLILRNGG
jgi:filamentous hemagglutinin family protein